MRIKKKGDIEYHDTEKFLPVSLPNRFSHTMNENVVQCPLTASVKNLNDIFNIDNITVKVYENSHVCYKRVTRSGRIRSLTVPLNVSLHFFLDSVKNTPVCFAEDLKMVVSQKSHMYIDHIIVPDAQCTVKKDKNVEEYFNKLNHDGHYVTSKVENTLTSLQFF
jgi:hypothetical protein